MNQSPFDAIRRRHLDAVNSTDVDLQLDDMTDDVVYIAQDALPILGRDALRSFIEPLYAQAQLSSP